MKLCELIISAGIDPEHVVFIRHSLNDEVVAENRRRDLEARAAGRPPGRLDFYQRVQTRALLDGYKYLLSFLSADGTNAVLYGCFTINGFQEEIKPESVPADFFVGDDGKGNALLSFGGCVLWDLERLSKLGETDILSDLEGRLVIDWGKDSINWFKPASRKNAINIEVMYIEPPVSEYEFQGFDKVVLSFSQLSHIVNNKKSHRIWEEQLSSHAGVYLITDVKTGKHYVGSATGENGGLWGRWRDYANTKHGGNKRLIKLLEQDKNYCENFQFAILEVFPIKRDKHEVLQYEQLYKKKLRSIEHGLNDN